MHTHTITIPPTPLTTALDVAYRLTFDHGAEQVIRLTLTRVDDEADHVTGTIVIESDPRVQDVAPA